MDSGTNGRLEFSITLSFPLISAHSGSLAGFGAGLWADSRAGWERFVLSRFLGIGCRVASVAGWIWSRSGGAFGSGLYHGMGVYSGLGRDGCQFRVGRLGDRAAARRSFGELPSRTAGRAGRSHCCLCFAIPPVCTRSTGCRRGPALAGWRDFPVPPVSTRSTDCQRGSAVPS